MKENKEPVYFGSVRFFKNMILLTVALCIAAPTVGCVVLATHNRDYRERLQAVDTAQLPPAEVPVSDMPTSGQSPEEDFAVEEIAMETPAWKDLCPELYAAPAQRSTVNTDKVVYLTFDDGPSPITPQVLAVLKKYDVKATFFVVGKRDEQSRQWMRDIVADGHTLGMHSNSHNYKQIYASPEAFLEDYSQIYQLILDVTGVAPQVSRFPGGSINSYNATTYGDITAELVRRGFVYFDWNVATGDAVEGGTVPAAKLVKNATGNLDSLRRAVILMHDSAGKKTTAEALPRIIEAYQKAGFTFMALTPKVTPVVYSSPY